MGKLTLGISGVKHSKPRDIDILYAIDRNIDRNTIFKNKKVLAEMHGVDIWNAYEFTWMLSEHISANRILQLVIDASSANTIESKSLKLYLNSYETIQATEAEVVDMIEKDLSAFLDTQVHVYVFTDDLFMQEFPIKKYLFGLRKKTSRIEYDNLRSNCKFTKQPDSGYAEIIIDDFIPRDLVISYLAQMRYENHFHEEIAERLFQKLMLEEPDTLIIGLNYLRRGGIDINPIRTNLPGEQFLESLWTRKARQ